MEGTSSMKLKEMSIDQLLETSRTQQAQHIDLWDMLVTRAQLQYYTEAEYTALMKLVHEEIAFLASLQAGDVITPEWIKQKDELAERANRFLQDMPTSPDTY